MRALADRKWPVKCPRSSHFGSSQPPSGSAELGIPAFVRKLWTSRSAGSEFRYSVLVRAACRKGPSSKRTFSNGNGIARMGTPFCPKRGLCGSGGASKETLAAAPDAILGMQASAADESATPTNSLRERFLRFMRLAPHVGFPEKSGQGDFLRPSHANP